jgi:hypothetical protein
MRVLSVVVLAGLLGPAPVVAQQLLRPQEIFRTGSVDDPKTTLSLISGIARHEASSRLVVLQPLDGTVVIVTPDGAIERRFGRKGKGPGEFSGQGFVGVVGDTIWVIDLTGGRISFFQMDGEFIDAWPNVVSLRMMSTPFAVLRDHRLLQAVLPIEGDRLILVRATREGEAITVVDSIPRVGVGTIRYRGSGYSFSMRSPVSAEAIRAVSGTGAYFAIVHRDIAPSRRQAAFRVRVFDATARPIFDRKYDYQPKPIADAVKKAFVEESYAQLAAMPGPLQSNESLRATVRRVIADSIRYPDWQPPVGNALVTDGGGVWLEREIVRPDSTRWEYMDRTGKHAMSVDLPRGVRYSWADEREMCGGTEGDLGEPQLVCWRLVPSAR